MDQIKKSNILIIDERQKGSSAFDCMRENSELQFMKAGSSDEALSILLEHDIAVIFLNVELPDLAGFKAAEIIRNLDESKYLSMIFFTSTCKDNMYASMGYEKGAFDFLVEPLDPSLLKNKINLLSDIYRIRCKYENHIQEADVILEEIERVNMMYVNSEIESLEFRQIFNTSTGMLWVIDEDFKVIETNDSFADLLGKDKNTIIGKKCYDLFPNSLCLSDDCALNQVKKSNRPLIIDIESKLNDDGAKSFIMTATPFRGIDGKFMGIVEDFKNITDRKLAEKELERLAMVDELTQLANRRRFDECLRNEWQRLKREGAPLSLIMCDVDYFKQYNDSYGHKSGDDCLIAVAQGISSQIKRPADLTARYGGEEFAVVLPNTPSEGAFHVAENIRKRVHQIRIAHSSSDIDPSVTLSLGVSTIIPANDSSPDVLIKLADKALYEAKENGRNQTRAIAPPGQSQDLFS
ncbi:MAG: diguanylate cyclase [candidate division Zixibacteria bacterium]|nr:diguanylate cyclase [candidate division Zixibacteria bacterium]